MATYPSALALEDEINAALDNLCLEFAEKSRQMTSAKYAHPPYESKVQALERVCAVHRTVVQHAHRGFANVIRQQNALLPIHSLPPDLFVPIIALSLDSAAENYYTSWPMYVSIPYYEKLRRLRLVSSLWDDLIVATPNLWIYLNSDQTPATIRHALSRSRDAPLTVNIRDWQPIVHVENHTARFLDQVAPHAHRWGSLEITRGQGRMVYGEPSPPALGMDSFFPTPLTSLQILQLRLAQERDDASIKPLNLSRKDLPALREVELTGLQTFLWPWQALGGLRSLHLSRITSQALPSCDQLFHVLSASPQLAALTLEDMDVTPTYRTAAPPTLPNLRRLRLSGLPEPLVTALFYLTKQCTSVHLGLIRCEPLTDSRPLVATAQHLRSTLLSSSTTFIDVTISAGFHTDNLTLTFLNKSWTLIIVDHLSPMERRGSVAWYLLPQIRLPATVKSTSISIPSSMIYSDTPLDYQAILKTMNTSLPATDRLLLTGASTSYYREDEYLDESSRILQILTASCDGRPMFPRLRQVVIGAAAFGPQDVQSLIDFARARTEALQVQAGVSLAERVTSLASLTIEGVSQMTMAMLEDGSLETLRELVPEVTLVRIVEQEYHVMRAGVPDAIMIHE